MRHFVAFCSVVLLTACTLTPSTALPQATQASITETVSTNDATATPLDATETPLSDNPTATVDTQTVPSGGEILVLSSGDLVGVAVTDSSRRTIMSGVSAFAASPDGLTIAAIRGKGASGELWTVRRDGSDAKQHTDDQRSLASLQWLPDSSGFLYAASNTDSVQQTTWLEWAAFCRQSTIIRRNRTDPKEYPMGEGCDPAVSPDGKRIAYATRPSRTDASAADPGNTAGNAIHLINMAGENGWDPVSATGAEPGQEGQGLVVYHPVWTPDSKHLLVSVFVGNRVETDINMLTQVDASAGTSKLLGTSAGWNRAIQQTRDGATYLLTTQNTGNARGSQGWDTWQTSVFTMTGVRDIYLPDGVFEAIGTALGETLNRAQFAAWDPDGTAVAVVMPPDWDPAIAPNEDYGRVDEPGELWLWRIGEIPTTKLSTPVDAASPIQWVP